VAPRRAGPGGSARPEDASGPRPRTVGRAPEGHAARLPSPPQARPAALQGRLDGGHANRGPKHPSRSSRGGRQPGRAAGDGPFRVWTPQVAAVRRVAVGADHGVPHPPWASSRESRARPGTAGALPRDLRLLSSRPRPLSVRSLARPQSVVS
jgi:hypothetical protein